MSNSEGFNLFSVNMERYIQQVEDSSNKDLLDSCLELTENADQIQKVTVLNHTDRWTPQQIVEILSKDSVDWIEETEVYQVLLNEVSVRGLMRVLLKLESKFL